MRDLSSLTRIREPSPLHRKHGVLTSGHQGSPGDAFLLGMQHGHGKAFGLRFLGPQGHWIKECREEAISTVSRTISSRREKFRLEGNIRSSPRGCPL